MNQNPKKPIQKPLQQIVGGKTNGQAYMVARAQDHSGRAWSTIWKEP
jgi:hypothetical protein